MRSEAAVIEHETAQALTTPAATPMAMLDRAIASGASMDVLEKLMALQERWEKSQARKAFDTAMAAAKAEIPVISKNREVDFTSQKGRTNYRYEDLGEIARTIDPILARHGLSYRFRATSNANEPVTVTCVVSHRDGHAEEITLSAGRDESGNKNAIQSVGSAITFLQRYSLKAALGLAAATDDDGKAAGSGELIDDQQREWLQACIVETGTDIQRFLKYLGVAQLADLTKAQYPRAIDALNAKRKASVPA